MTALLCSVYAGAQQAGDLYTGYDTTRTDEVLYEIRTVNRINADSALVTIGYGRRAGIGAGAEGNIFTSHNSGAPAGRENVVYIANARIISLTDTSAVASVKLYSKYKGTVILPKDLLAVNTFPVREVETNVFYELAKLDVLFLGNARQEIKGKTDILKFPNSSFEFELMDRYTKEIHDFYTDLLEYKDSTFTKPYTSGPYKGMNMHQVFEKVTRIDLMDFFHFVRKYPGKYIGGRWKINETFATWVLNNAPQGELNREWIIPVIRKYKDNGLSLFSRRYRYMIEADTLSHWTSQVWEFQNRKQTTEAADLCDRLIHVAQILEDKHAESEFLYTRSLLKDAAGDTKEALKDAQAVYETDKTNLNYSYNLANIYGKLEQFDNCFALYRDLLKALPDNYNIKGNYGWYMLSAGQIDEATPFCRAAYLADPSSVAFTVNYGHTFLLKGNMDSARYYYQKTLDNLSTPADYLTGPRTDFDLFFKKGWERKSAAEMADWMEKEFNEKYAAITRGNEIWTEARAAYDKKNYRLAVSNWKKYIALFGEVTKKPYSSIHNAYNWIGASYSRMKLYDSAFIQYETAMKIARDQLVAERNNQTDKDNDFLVSDYERLYNLCVTAGLKDRAEHYKMLYDAEAEKVTELFANPALHLLVVSGSGKSNEQDADFFYSRFSNLKKENQEGMVTQLKGNGLTRDKLTATLEEIRRKSKPEDIFIFYYAGNISGVDNASFLDFRESDSLQGRISITEFMNSLDFVYAHKKMIITDKPSTPLLSLITTRYVNAGKNAPEVIYLSPGMETPVQDNGVSLFTSQLGKTLDELQKLEKFSAKDFVDKASFSLGRGQYYFPVLSFSFGKDFLLFENKALPAGNPEPASLVSRGTETRSTRETASVASTGPQKNYALLVATDLYNDPGFDKLSNPIYDMETVGKLLREEFGFEVTIVRNPTLDGIESQLSEFRDSRNYGSNDQLFLFFAGHGVYDERSKMGYLVARDSKLKDPNYKSYLSYSDLGNKYLKNISCNRIFLVLDACFAGTFFDDNSVRGTPQEANARNLEALNKMAANQHFYKGISSGAKQYVEDGKPGQHSPFAAKFLTTLWNKAMNKSFVTADEIIGEIKSNPPGSTAICEGKFHYSDPFSHFIFELKSGQKVTDIKSSESNPAPTSGRK
ncbi:MAG: caspase family protein [Chitinophagaceae bacterium]